MSSSADKVTPHLETWDSIKDNFVGGSLLVGNGASCAVWEAFGYKSLFKVATDSDSAEMLAGTDQELFTAFDTINFEQVLSALATTQKVCEALDVPSEFAAERYQRIQNALVSAVHSVHVPHIFIDQSALSYIGDALYEYERVYSTNYDLLLYWGLMSLPKSRWLIDHFFRQDSDRFDPTNTTPFDSTRSSILYLHGGLHLVGLAGGGTRKVRRDSAGALLDKFGQGLGAGESPLVVTEGNAGNKLRSIKNSDYLAFAYKEFQENSRPLVVFGHSLSKCDQHIVDAIKMHQSRRIAIAIHASDPEIIIERKLGYLSALHPIVPVFFNAATHPLGSPNLRVPEPEGEAR